ncbi:hypothetical protein N7326_07935 [Corynebacterium sp. ES2794-CONJ1]|uniref:hypothetical protein n=1 Tax=unclassified Corynebacterium TaxID=2624378 RepID=UPI002168835D|nr:MULTISPECIES: hypothetical protein [unclassified Corynebacterium]MCS4490494.1 hypothetical protein [Corynebacterium sp. ES2775-CONJ]MCS4492274.1 hypothetical protein [Corynebacterium sp. ES2715-CONJ3]MCS4532242.1 hypothetical protein [Corynebacterium sp. ES2730-CONJ]MCU9519793.1 hypothetical protein [Corynebacterium sp. ES2794-CONJ1]
MAAHTLVAIISVMVGFALFTGSFLSHYYDKKPQLTWSLFSIALVFITVIPVIIGVAVSL